MEAGEASVEAPEDDAVTPASAPDQPESVNTETEASGGGDPEVVYDEMGQEEEEAL